ncbi:hypothetical protein PsorP6_002921 [Peronosclerospora sorghi]|uniref:Uncharacterized protein n=1 Tax=Peronosclerospora sorghi TaxID=230839 RepID=A0ACC0VRM0_9STRA|nr:hypothetical protein PsorP6_002921 [Peronosclerospora sorghi]
MELRCVIVDEDFRSVRNKAKKLTTINFDLQPFLAKSPGGACFTIVLREAVKTAEKIYSVNATTSSKRARRRGDATPSDRGPSSSVLWLWQEQCQESMSSLRAHDVLVSLLRGTQEAGN